MIDSLGGLQIDPANRSITVGTGGHISPPRLLQFPHRSPPGGTTWKSAYDDVLMPETTHHPDRGVIMREAIS